MQKRIAILYDFDYTLSNGFMQEFGLMQDLGYDDVMKFFAANEDTAKCTQMDMCLSMMCGVVMLAKKHGRKVTKEYLQNFGKDIKYYEGVKEWFAKINKVGKKRGYEIEHYIISSGLKEIIEGTSIAKHFKRIYANFYAYDENGEAFWPSQVVNFTSKTQYIYRVRKMALDDLSSLDKINRKMPDAEVLPFKNFIYLGDSQTDIPSFKVIKNGGGMSICVYDENSENAKNVAQKCFIEGRVNYFTPADYREGSDLYNLVVDYINSVITHQEESENNN